MAKKNKFIRVADSLYFKKDKDEVVTGALVLDTDLFEKIKE